MNYGPGDAVVCIDSLIENGRLSIRAGEKYTVHRTTSTCALLRELPFPRGYKGNYCQFCRERGPETHWHYEGWRFIKLDGLTVSDEREEEVYE